MVDAVVPVIEEVVGDQRADPDPPVVGAQRKEGGVIVDEDIDADAERQHEDAGDLAEDSGGERPDRVVEPVDLRPVASPTQNSAAISATNTGMA